MPRRAANNHHTVADVVAHLERLGDTKASPIDAEIILHNRRGQAARDAALFFQQVIRYVDVLLDRIDELRAEVDRLEPYRQQCVRMETAVRDALRGGLAPQARADLQRALDAGASAKGAR